MTARDTVKRGCKIRLTRGFKALIDSDFLKEVTKHSWCVSGDSRYAVSRIKGKTVYLHRFLLRLNDPKIKVDHINGNGLDCRKSNMRICSQKENAQNQRLNNLNTSGYKGVSFHKSTGKWRAYIKSNGKQIHLGLHEDIMQAAKAYNAKALELFKNFANLNEVHE